MKKAIILLLLIIPSVLAITLQIPDEREIIFEPYKNVSLTYQVGSTQAQPLKIAILVSNPVIDPYIKQKSAQMEIPPFGRMPFELIINFPEQLDSGIYQLRTETSEAQEEAGMSGIAGAADIINIISPYEHGYPYGRLFLDKFQKTGVPIKFYIDVQNIGKETIDKLQPQAELIQNGQIVQRTFTDTLPPLTPLAKGRLAGEFEQENLLPGEYEIQVRLGEQELTTEFVYGQPKIQITGVPILRAGEQNKFQTTLTVLDWATPLEQSTIKFHVTNLITSEQQQDLNPGDNIINIDALANTGKTGTYTGRVNINSGLAKAKTTFSTGVEGSIAGEGGVGFRPTPEQQTPFGTALDGAEKAVRENLLLVIILVAAFAIFSYALGRYASKKRNP